MIQLKKIVVMERRSMIQQQKYAVMLLLVMTFMTRQIVINAVLQTMPIQLIVADVQMHQIVKQSLASFVFKPNVPTSEALKSNFTSIIPVQKTFLENLKNQEHKLTQS